MIPWGFFDRGPRAKVRDFTFLVAYYPRPHHAHDNEFRLELIRKLREDRSLSGIAAFASHHPIPAPYSAYAADFISVRRLLDMYATSRVGVYVRGMHDCLSLKLGQYLALGLPIAGQSISLDNRFARAIPNFDSQFSGATPDDIVRNVRAASRRPPT